MEQKNMSVSESCHNSDIVSKKQKSCFYCKFYDYEVERALGLIPICSKRECIVKSLAYANECSFYMWTNAF